MVPPAMAASNTLQPVSVDERIDLIDVVRGFALFGVLLANLVWATTDVVLTDARIAGLPTAPFDRLGWPDIASGPPNGCGERSLMVNCSQ
jgi:uncharacterized membrane protein YeiB